MRRKIKYSHKLVVPCKPDLSLTLRISLVPEVGGLADTHQGGRQFASQDNADWQNMKAWVLDQKATVYATPERKGFRYTPVPIKIHNSQKSARTEDRKMWSNEYCQPWMPRQRNSFSGGHL